MAEQILEGAAEGDGGGAWPWGCVRKDRTWSSRYGDAQAEVGLDALRGLFQAHQWNTQAYSLQPSHQQHTEPRGPGQALRQHSHTWTLFRVRFLSVQDETHKPTSNYKFTVRKTKPSPQSKKLCHWTLIHQTTLKSITVKNFKSYLIYCLKKKRGRGYAIFSNKESQQIKQTDNKLYEQKAETPCCCMPSMLCKNDAESRFPCYHHTYAKSFSSCGFTFSLPSLHILQKCIYLNPFSEMQEIVHALFQ